MKRKVLVCLILVVFMVVVVLVFDNCFGTPQVAPFAVSKEIQVYENIERQVLHTNNDVQVIVIKVAVPENKTTFYVI